MVFVWYLVHTIFHLRHGLFSYSSIISIIFMSVCLVLFSSCTLNVLLKLLLNETRLEILSYVNKHLTLGVIVHSKTCKQIFPAIAHTHVLSISVFCLMSYANLSEIKCIDISCSWCMSQQPQQRNCIQLC